MRRTSPTSLIPGSNLVGMANLIILEQLRKPKLSAFGLFDVSTVVESVSSIKNTSLYRITRPTLSQK